tara:strand:- start:211 stop:723 length:513 start_codon:yes stop_codon:yes gene_type:complete
VHSKITKAKATRPNFKKLKIMNATCGVLALNKVCLDFNIPDDVLNIIIQYVKSNVFKTKICRLFNNYLKPQQDLNEERLQKAIVYFKANALRQADTSLSLFDLWLENEVIPQIYVSPEIDDVEVQVDFESYEESKVVKFIVKSIEQGGDCKHTEKLLQTIWVEENEIEGY